MNTRVTIEGPNGFYHVTNVSEAAEQRARLTFNPSANHDVTGIKSLIAALYTVLAEVRDNSGNIAAREAATAMTELQGGAMFAVSAVTASDTYGKLTGGASGAPAHPDKLHPLDVNTKPGDHTPEGAALGEELAKQEAAYKSE